MDDLKVGAMARAVRHRRRWKQRDVAARAGVSQQLVSLFERGRIDELTVRSARHIAAALEIRLPFAPWWRGGDGLRLVDADHAVLVDGLVAILVAAGWEVVVEYTFNHFGERGSVDVVGWHPASRSLLIAEVKSRLLDSQETLAVLHRKARIAPRLLERERGWMAAQMGVVLAMQDTTANRSAVARHPATFASAFPDRPRAARRWLREPHGPLHAVWFLPLTNRGGATRQRATMRRVR